MFEERSNKSFENLSRLGEESDEFSQNNLGESSVNFLNLINI